jgi:thiamine-monophosphate kinase
MSKMGACIDVSDGLLADLRHLLRASGVGARVDLARVPRPRGFAAGCRRLGLDPEALALGGGEDFELLFTLRRSGISEAALSRRLDIRVTEIGEITSAGEDDLPKIEGWRHF